MFTIPAFCFLNKKFFNSMLTHPLPLSDFQKGVLMNE